MNKRYERVHKYSIKDESDK